jgi:hypothetical protein
MKGWLTSRWSDLKFIKRTEANWKNTGTARVITEPIGPVRRHHTIDTDH